MLFDAIRGQDRAIACLRHAIANDTVAHAYIFLGPSGIGKRMTAVTFAQAVNCLRDGERPCGECPSCAKVAHGNHPDLFLAAPEDGGGAIKIAVIRELIKAASFKPYEGRRKVFIVDGADAMTDEASNALLKTLEEPPAAAVIILIVENLGALPATIISRSQIVTFFPLASGEVTRILTAGPAMDGREAAILARVAGGSPGRALEYRKSGFFAMRTAVLRNIRSRSFWDADIDRLSKDEVRFCLGIILLWYRDLLVAASAAPDPALLVNVDMREAITDEAARLTRGRIERILERTAATIASFDRNANVKLAMAVLGAEIAGAS